MSETNFFRCAFVEALKQQYGTEYSQILSGFTAKVLSFRVNLLKATANEIYNTFFSKDIPLSKVDWADDVFYCDNQYFTAIKNSEEYSSGKIYLQSLSSCLPVIFLNPQPNEDILDMAAAPGGKTTQIASLTGGKANITACERNPMRAEKLKHNLNIQGVKNVNVITKDARQLEDWFKFDKILLDAPCSGSGTLISENNNDYFTEKLINNTVKTQKALIDKAVKLLKKNGILVYSTCSVLKQENEDIISKYINQNILEVVNINAENISSVPILPSKLDGTLTVCPNKFYEGFFVSVLRKK